MGGQAEILPRHARNDGFLAKGVGSWLWGTVGGLARADRKPPLQFPMSLEGVQAAEVTSLAGLLGAGR